MEHFTVFNKEHSAGVTCRFGTVGHHQNRLSRFIDLTKKFDPASGAGEEKL